MSLKEAYGGTSKILAKIGNGVIESLLEPVQTAEKVQDGLNVVFSFGGLNRPRPAERGYG